MSTHTQYKQIITTRWADVDANRHLKHSAYADWATHTRVEWLNSHGFTLKKFTELQIAPIIFEETTKYFKEIYMSEQITIDLMLVGLNHDASRYHLRQYFRRGDTVCAQYEIKGAWLDVASRRIAPPPPGLLEATTNLQRADDYAEIVSQTRQ
ncbi:acyl-CoA thioesterase [Parachitinimonas caeni]|uniref:Thioesterase family protein n=1 Tax=Parachitinimonas caeni TaxID=3031301 RepID=A0ABT7DRQ4_9NEIS|nr:thioesterase family protein [Parachitinimonas caeni]MDK2122750.1 thioesterase family protein [Parachitinimonas caeni]